MFINIIKSQANYYFFKKLSFVFECGLILYLLLYAPRFLGNTDPALSPNSPYEEAVLYSTFLVVVTVIS